MTKQLAILAIARSKLQAPGFIRGVLTANYELRTANCTDPCFTRTSRLLPIKAILRASARDVKTGRSNGTCLTTPEGQPAGNRYDGAMGARLVDAYGAYQLARSAF